MSKCECDNMDGSNKKELHSISATREKIKNIISKITATETLELAAGLNRVTAEDITSSIDVPPFNNSAMDGYAFKHADLATYKRLKQTGIIYAGEPYLTEIRPGECVRIMTGAVVPDSVDTVVMQEKVEHDGDHIVFPQATTKGSNIRPQGDDLIRGSHILDKGTRLNAAHIAYLAAVGQAKITAYKRPRVCIFSTGDEITGLGQILQPGKIYDSNRYAINAMLANLSCEVIDKGVLADDKNLIKETLEQASQQADIIVTSGGVSVGDADFVKQVLDEIGTVDLWRIAMKPGKPLAVGKIHSALFFGLPGNPVAAITSFYQFVGDAIRLTESENIPKKLILKAICSNDIKKTKGRTDFQRGFYSIDNKGNLQVSTQANQGSHVLSSIAHANCFVILPADVTMMTTGDTVEIEPFMNLL